MIPLFGCGTRHSISWCDMNGWEARSAWRRFNFNWLPIAALGLALAVATGRTDFSLEPVAFGITCAVALALASIVYAHWLLKADAADPKLVFWLVPAAQVILPTAIAGHLS